jgi:hypothetical protein
LLQEEFESSSIQTPEFKKFSSVFKKEFRNLLLALDCTNVEFNVGHFFISGFFTYKEQAYYFSLNDVRNFNNDSMLLRTAKNYKDYSGGSNNWVSLESPERLANDISNLLGIR